MKETIRRYFAILGLRREIADIYVALHENGAQTLSELARTSGIERTKIYRLLSDLKTTGLVEVETQYKREILRAAPIDNIEIYLSNKEQNLRAARASFPTVEQLLLNNHPNKTTKVQFYKSIEGLKQMYWNDANAKTEVLAMMNENMQIHTKSAFFERWVRRCNENNVTVRGLVNDDFIASQQKWYGKRSNERLNHWEARYVPAKLFAITHRMIIYDNIVAYHNRRNNDVFGIEIHNQMIADTQRHFFEMLWRQAQPIDDLTGKKS